MTCCNTTPGVPTVVQGFVCVHIGPCMITQVPAVLHGLVQDCARSPLGCIRLRMNVHGCIRSHQSLPVCARLCESVLYYSGFQGCVKHKCQSHESSVL